MTRPENELTLQDDCNGRLYLRRVVEKIDINYIRKYSRYINVKKIQEMKMQSKEILSLSVSFKFLLYAIRVCACVRACVRVCVCVCPR